jgi:hypothetical protein
MAERRWDLAVIALAVVLGSSPAAAAWLDAGAPDPWNRAGIAVPRAPQGHGNDDPRCRMGERPPESPEERELAARGWRLFRGYLGGFGLRVVWALSAYDGMCRPMGYQVFVFAGGAFAGTIAPDPMASRTDGAAVGVDLFGPAGGNGGARIVATFNRYAPGDPLCCPSRTTTVQYRIDRQAGGPVLVPAHVATSRPGP